MSSGSGFHALLLEDKKLVCVRRGGGVEFALDRGGGVLLLRGMDGGVRGLESPETDLGRGQHCCASVRLRCGLVQVVEVQYVGMAVGCANHLTLRCGGRRGLVVSLAVR